MRREQEAAGLAQQDHLPIHYRGIHGDEFANELLRGLEADQRVANEHLLISVEDDVVVLAGRVPDDHSHQATMSLIAELQKRLQ